MRLTTWNVNGIRNPFSYQPWNSARTFPAMFDILESDIIVMQELKIQRKDLRDDMVILEGWDCYFSLPKHKKGYSGVGIYTRNAACAPTRAEEGLLGVLPSPSGVPFRDLPEDQHIGGYPNAVQIADLDVDPAALDAEGRCVVLEFPAFVLFGVYCPANSNGLRDDFRHAFIRALDLRIRNLIRDGKRVVLVGDLNVSRDERDTASALEDMRKSGVTHSDYISTPNRRIFNQLLVDGEVVGDRDEGREDGVLWDTTRIFHPQRQGMYTHWEQKINARPGNYGSRIDFVLVSTTMRPWIRDANIQEGLLGSDHCPVFVDFHDSVSMTGAEESKVLHDIMSPLGHIEDGARKIEWKLQTTPGFSAKRLPEFDRRRSIKSMFAAPTLKKSQSSQFLSVEGGEETPSTSVPVVTSDTDLPAPEVAMPITTTSVSLSKASSPIKRKAPTPVKDRSLKRQKSDAQQYSTKGQQSLKGFFQAKERLPKGTQPENGKQHDGITETYANAVVEETNMDTNTVKFEVAQDSVAPPTPQTPISVHTSYTKSASPSPRHVASQVASAEQSQRSWGALFTRPVAPMCEHSEPCKTMQTKKKGSNQGRSFWMCARPLGPSGDKERGTQWRCSTFIWCSDWTARADSGKEEKTSSLPG